MTLPHQLRPRVHIEQLASLYCASTASTSVQHFSISSGSWLMCPLFQRVIDAFASIVCPAGAADLHVLPLQRFYFLFRNTAAVLATRAGRGRFAPCVHFAPVSNAA